MVEVSPPASGKPCVQRWLIGRFAIANVDDEVIVSLEPRLRRMNALMEVR